MACEGHRGGGCKFRPIAWWREHHVKECVENGYSPDEIAFYGAAIEALALIDAVFSWDKDDSPGEI
jgi:hypothetical protein